MGAWFDNWFFNFLYWNLFCLYVCCKLWGRFWNNSEFIKTQGETGSSLILSEGSPENWEGLNNTETPGILTNNKINQTKLDRFYNITDTSTEYQRTKNRLDITKEFYFNFSGIKVNGEEVEGIGKKPNNANNLIKTERVTIYENKITEFNFYVWS